MSMSSASSRSTGSTITVASTAAALALVPAFLVGATGPFIREELDFGAGTLGLVVSTYWTAMALSGAFAGRLVQRWGGATGLRVGVGLACVALMLVSLAPVTAVVFAGMALGGVASAVITPATDLVVIQRVPEHRLGLAFGIKQSALPAASLLAGVGVPVLALTLGWRWTFVAVAALAVPTVALVRASWNGISSARPLPEAPSRAPGADEALRRLRPLALAMGLAMAAVSSTGAFYVQAALDKGIGAGDAGLLLAAGSAVGIAGRFMLTWKLSHRSNPFGIVAGLTAVGAVGILGIAAAPDVRTLLVATLVAFGAGWGWNGLFTHAVVAGNRHAAARASGMLVAASATGGMLGPSVFGLLAATLGVSAAWGLASMEMLLASALCLSATRVGARTPSPHGAATPPGRS